MENFEKLNWSWYTVRTGAEQLKYFDVDFANNEKDVFFCHLNEIDPSLITKQHIEDDSNNIFSIPIDPRTKSEIINIEIDHSNTKKKNSEEESFVFKNYPTKSALKQSEHQACLRVLQGNGTTKDLEIFTETNDRRIKENDLFNQFLQNHFTANYNEINSRGEIINNLYLDYLKQESKYILEQPNRIYSIQTALPIFNAVDENNMNGIDFLNPEIIYKTGCVHELNQECNYSKLFSKSSLGKVEKFHETDNKIVKIEKKFIHEHEIDIILPENTLFILLNTILGCNETWQIEFNINKNNEDDTKRNISFHEPLPLPDLSSQSRILICEKLQPNMFGKYFWYSLEDDKILSFGLDDDETEITAVNLQKDYRIFEFENYLYNLNLQKSSPANNSVFFKWNLNLDEFQINLLTRKRLQFYKNENGETFFVNKSIKLEFKSEFGVEIMTKTELLNEWIKLFLMPADSWTERVRVDLKTLKPILKEKLSLKKIEEEMFRLHKMEPLKDFLKPLQNILKLLMNFPSGDYLLKYNPKYLDKIMVYLKTDLISKNTINLHEIYTNCTENLDLLKSINFIPIDESRVTNLHEIHKILPACFPHSNGFIHQIPINDKINIIKKTKQKEIEKIMKEKQKKQQSKKLRNKIKNRNQKKRIILKKSKETENDNWEPDNEFIINPETCIIKKPENNSRNLSFENFDFNLTQYLEEAKLSSNSIINKDDKEIVNSREIEKRKVKSTPIKKYSLRSEMKSPKDVDIIEKSKKLIKHNINKKPVRRISLRTKAKQIITKNRTK